MDQLRMTDMPVHHGIPSLAPSVLSPRLYALKASSTIILDSCSKLRSSAAYFVQTCFVWMPRTHRNYLRCHRCHLGSSFGYQDARLCPFSRGEHQPILFLTA